MTAVYPVTLYHGTFVHPKDLKHLEILLHATVGVNEAGTIVFIDKHSANPQQALEKWLSETPDIVFSKDNVKVVEIADMPAAFFFPGFFDTHIVCSCSC